MASPGNWHCANYIGALSFPIVSSIREHISKTTPLTAPKFYAYVYGRCSTAIRERARKHQISELD